MAGKPRVVSVSDKPRKPRVVEEVDYSRMIEKKAGGSAGEEEARKEPVLFKGLEEARKETREDTARDELRRQALKDITPLTKEEIIRQAEEDRQKRKGIGGRVRQFLGLE